MKTSYTLLLKSLLIPILLTGFSGCIREDLSNCYGLRLLVKFDPDMFELPEDEHRIESVHIYVFDENNLLVTSWEGGEYNYRSGAEYEVPLDLDEGIYQFIAWTNHGDHYRTYGLADERTVATLHELRLHLKDPGDQCYREDIPDLHYGMVTQAVNNPTHPHEYTILLIPDTYRINITVKGLKASGDEYDFIIRDNNSHFSFDNSVVPDMYEIQHIRTCSFNEEKLSASMRVLSLTNGHSLVKTASQSDRNAEFTFRNVTTGTTHYTDGLVKMIRKAYESAGKEVDFDTTYEFNIILTFDAKMNVTISVNGWEYQYNPTEL